MSALLVVEAVCGVLLALVAATAVAGLSGGGGAGFVVLVTVVSVVWAGLLVLASRQLPSRRGRLGVLAGQAVPVAVVLVYSDVPGGLALVLGLGGLAAQLLTTPPVRFVRER